MTVSLLAFGSQPSPGEGVAKAVTGVGSAVDVSTLATLRLDIDTTGTNMGCDPDLEVYFDHAPTTSGPWTQFSMVKQSHSFGPKKHVVLSGFDNAVRVRWQVLQYGNGSLNFSLGVTGTGVAGTVT